jgi:hypothetical protein
MTRPRKYFDLRHRHFGDDPLGCAASLALGVLLTGTL